MVDFATADTGEDARRDHRSPQFGGWSYEYATQRWTIDPGLLRLLDAGTEDVHDPEPVVERIPEAEREAYVTRLAGAIEQSTGFASRFSVETESGGLVTFLSVGDVVRDEQGRPSALRGFSADITEELRLASDHAVGAATQHRRAIEQVKGALMFAYGVEEELAFALLRRESNAHNVKVNALCEVVSRAMRQIPTGTARPSLTEMIEDAGQSLRQGAPSG